MNNVISISTYKRRKVDVKALAKLIKDFNSDWNEYFAKVSEESTDKYSMNNKYED